MGPYCMCSGEAWVYCYGIFNLRQGLFSAPQKHRCTTVSKPGGWHSTVDPDRPNGKIVRILEIQITVVSPPLLNAVQDCVRHGRVGLNVPRVRFDCPPKKR